MNYWSVYILLNSSIFIFCIAQHHCAIYLLTSLQTLYYTKAIYREK